MRNRIAHYRKKAGMSQTDLAHLLGIGRSHVSSWETGRKVPRVDTAQKIALALTCTLDDLFPAIPSIEDTPRPPK